MTTGVDCGSFTYSVEIQGGGTVDASVFTTPLNNQLAVFTADQAEAALYNLQITVEYTLYSSNKHTKGFDVEILGACIPTSVMASLPPSGVSHTLVRPATVTSPFN